MTVVHWKKKHCILYSMLFMNTADIFYSMAERKILLHCIIVGRINSSYTITLSHWNKGYKYDSTSQACYSGVSCYNKKIGCFTPAKVDFTPYCEGKCII